jgi:hypothetical protein
VGRRASSRARRDSRRSATNEATRRLLDKQRRARARCRALRNANRRENVESDSVVSSRQPLASRRRAGGAGRGRARCASRNRSERRREEREVDVRRTWRRVCASLWPMSNLGRAFLTWQRKNLVFGVTRHARFVWAISLTALSDEKPRRPNRRSSRQRGSATTLRGSSRSSRVRTLRAPVKFAGAGAERQVAWRSIACSTS